MPSRPTIVPPDGKSGPGTSCRSARCRSSRGARPFLDHRDDAVDHFPHVVRRDARRHADGDARRAVDEQVRERRRQHRRFLRRLVEGRTEVHRLLVEVGHHRLGQRLETGFRVPVGGGRIAVDRSEIALPVHERVAHAEVLRQADERVVGGCVAVGMVVADDFADDLRALAVRTVRREAHLPHREQHAAIGRLQTVADVGKRAPDDHAHRVIHVRALHLVFDVDGLSGREIWIHVTVMEPPCASGRRCQSL